MRRCLPLALLALSAPAMAQERDFCANRPGIGTPPCTLAPGAVQVETTVTEWDRAADALSVENTLTFADWAVRVGVSESTEVQFGLTSLVRDRATGAVARTSGVGDAFVAVRQGVAGPNGPVAVQAYITAPIGAAGSGDWGAGVSLPVSLDLPDDFQLGLTPEIDAAVDGDGRGRHLAYGGVVGLSHPAGKKVTLGAELAAFEDLDPAGHTLDARLTGEVAWQVGPRLQLDIEADAGLSADAPDEVVVVGFAERL
jgi:hypothetical protein